jgi:hypothetical protein
MKFYQFVLYWRSNFFGYSGAQYSQSTYVVRREGEITSAWLESTASKLALAERVCVISVREIYRVVAFECKEDGEHDENTTTHTCVVRAGAALFEYKHTLGLRPAGYWSQYVGVTVGKNRVVGRVTKNFISGSVNFQDLATARHSKYKRKTPNLNMKGQFVKHSFPYYRWILEHLPGYDTSVEIDRFGKMRELETGEGRLTIGAIQVNSRWRRAIQSQSLEASFMQLVLHRAISYSDWACWEYRRQMERFTHHWGDGQVPELYNAVYWAVHASYVWVSLARALGYQVGDYTKNQSNIASWGILGWPALPPNKIVLKAREETVFRLVKTLCGIHQYLETEYPNGHRTNYQSYNNNNQFQRPGDIYTSYIPTAKRYYDDHENLSNAIFGINDALNLLWQIVQVANPKKNLPLNQRYGESEFPEWWQRPLTVLPPLEMDLFEACEPMSREPFLTTYSTAQATVKMAPDPYAAAQIPYTPPAAAPANAEEEIGSATREGIERRWDEWLMRTHRQRALNTRLLRDFGTPPILNKIGIQ